MSGTEFRILGELATCIGVMLPAGLLIDAWRRRKQPALAMAEGELAQETPPPFKLGKGELAVGMVLSLLLLAATFGAKAYELSHPEVTEKIASGSGSAGMMLINFAVMQGMQIGIVAAWFFTARRISLVKVFELKKYRFPRAMGLAAMLLVPAGIISLLAMLLVTLQLKHLGWPVEEQDAVQMLKGSKDIATVIVMVLGACVGAPLTEELIFRGMIYGSLKNLTNKWFAMIFSGLWFSIMHVSVPVFVPLALLGFFFALAYEITGSLTISILMHVLFNSVQVFLALQ